MLVEHLEPQGLGSLQLAFDQLKKKLEAEGLFAASRKRALPMFPRQIGIVTSPSGAVIRDVLHILTRRFPGLHLRLYPAAVQGAGSVEQVVAGIRYFSRSSWADVVIVCRGGGSLEDLWTFNTEPVARAIAECSVPVISAVGHETDFTIADFVADLRAPTPSAAAEMLIRPKEQFIEQVEAFSNRLERAMRLRLAGYLAGVHRLGFQQVAAALGRRIGRLAQRVDEYEFRLRERMLAFLRKSRRRVEQSAAKTAKADPRVRLSEARRRMEAAEACAVQAIRLGLARNRRRLEPLRAGLVQLSPLAILDRGYAIATNSEGKILTDARETSVGQTVNVRLASGRIAARVVNAINEPRK
jgi:exodeoxyribonuclease VII large subunit